MASDENEKPAGWRRIRCFSYRRAFLFATLGVVAAGVLGAVYDAARIWLIAPVVQEIDHHAGHAKSGPENLLPLPAALRARGEARRVSVCGMDLERFVDTGEVLPLAARVNVPQPASAPRCPSCSNLRAR